MAQVTSHPAALGNPLRALRSLARREDWVVLKLDIDPSQETGRATHGALPHRARCTNDVALGALLICAPCVGGAQETEEALIDQILADGSLAALIDELYFEHHVCPHLRGHTDSLGHTHPTHHAPSICAGPVHATVCVVTYRCTSRR